MKVTKLDWLRVAVQQMANHNIDGVKVEVLARQLNVSKGSFYWHFKNRGDLLAAIVELWQQETEDLIVEANKANSPDERMARLFSAIEALTEEYGTMEIDTAMFNWSLRDPKIAAVVKAVEVRRIAFIKGLLLDTGFTEDTAQFRAEFAYMTFVGFVDRAKRQPELRTPEKLIEVGQFLLQSIFTPAGASDANTASSS